MPTRRLALSVARRAGVERQARAAVSRVHRRANWQHVGDANPAVAWTALKAEMRTIVAGDGPITVGPWLSEVGFEVLYWIPFLRGLVRRFDIDPARITVVSRGGVESWYSGICGAYVDIFELMSVDEFRHANETRQRRSGGQKQMVLGSLDRHVLRLAAARANLEWARAGTLHPRLMYRFLHRYWKGGAGTAQILAHLPFARLAAPLSPGHAHMLPAGAYVAARFYSSSTFPPRPELHRLCAESVTRLAGDLPILLLDTGHAVDEHQRVLAEHLGERAVSLPAGISAAQNLHVQSVAISRATRFVGTYGGLAYLAPCYGVPATTYASAYGWHQSAHLDVARRLAVAMDAPFSVLEPDRAPSRRGRQAPHRHGAVPESQPGVARITWVMLHPGYTRNFERALRILLDRGHRIVLAFVQAHKQSSDRVAERLADEYSNLTIAKARKPARGRGQYIVRVLRTLADSARYSHPRYAAAHLLRRRAHDKVRQLGKETGRLGRIGLWLALLVVRCPRTSVLSDATVRLLLALERRIDPSPEVMRFAARWNPDLLLISPLVAIGSHEPEYVKCAKALGVRTGLCVASWDNLTNKGLIKQRPDRVYVWNEHQRREAIDLHGVPPDAVVATGAPRFDAWYEQRPTSTRAEFCATAEIPADRPFLLFVGSSPFIAPDEPAFVERLLTAIRDSDHVELRRAGVLIRPHPQNALPWISADLSRHGPVAVWPRAGEQPVNAKAVAAYYDSIYHSAAVIGINTSAQIEASVVGRSVHTLLAEETRGTQGATLHFQYLLQANGGPVRPAKSTPALLDDLAEVLAEPHVTDTTAFAVSFLRPRGLEHSASVCLADEIEAQLRAEAPHPEGDGYARDRPKPTRTPARRAGWRHVKTQMRAARRGTSGTRVVIGPWLNDVSTELLWWIPFLRWAVQHEYLAPERLVAVSRAGADPWYGGLCAEYVDAMDLMDPATFSDALRPSTYGAASRATSKQLRSAVLAALRRAGTARGGTLSPDLLDRIFGRFWENTPPFKRALTHLDLRRLPDAMPCATALPAEYIVVLAGFGPAFPDEQSNRSALVRLVRELAAQCSVVLLGSGPMGQTVRLAGVPADAIALGETGGARRALTDQSAAIAGATELVSPYGPANHLAAAHGVPSIGLVSHAHRLPHAEAAFGQHVARMRGTAITLSSAEEFLSLRS